MSSVHFAEWLFRALDAQPHSDQSDNLHWTLEQHIREFIFRHDNEAAKKGHPVAYLRLAYWRVGEICSSITDDLKNYRDTASFGEIWHMDPQKGAETFYNKLRQYVVEHCSNTYRELAKELMAAGLPAYN